MLRTILAGLAKYSRLLYAYAVNGHADVSKLHWKALPLADERERRVRGRHDNTSP